MQCYSASALVAGRADIKAEARARSLFDACRVAHLMSGRQKAVTGVRETVTALRWQTVSRKDGTDGALSWLTIR
jgi:hypothetical protein